MTTSLTLIRHATVLVELADQTFLVDPMLDPALVHEAVEGTSNPTRWPLVELPIRAADVVSQATAVLLTHTHVDHLDATAVGFLRAHPIPVYCQPFDRDHLTELGLPDVRPVEVTARVGRVAIRRTGGQHGTGELAELMGPVSGWLLEGARCRVYVAGDTVWCDDVAAVLARHRPSTVVVNAGAARMTVGEPITMDAADVVSTARHPAVGEVIAVHMEALNHCGLRREDLATAAWAAGVDVVIPRDGQRIALRPDGAGER